MSRLAILGASGHGKVVAEIADLSGWKEIVFFDDAFPRMTNIGVWSVQGTTADLLGRVREFDGCIVAIGDNAIRLEKSELIHSSQGCLISLIHPSSVISQYASVGLGSVVMAGAVINAFSSLGMACIVNTLASIDHDCDLAESVHISPGSNLAGGVTIGKQSWVGIGVSIKQELVIGENVIIGAGAAVVSDVCSGLVVTGVPAKVRSPLDPKC